MDGEYESAGLRDAGQVLDIWYDAEQRRFMESLNCMARSLEKPS